MPVRLLEAASFIAAWRGLEEFGPVRSLAQICIFEFTYCLLIFFFSITDIKGVETAAVTERFNKE